MSNRYLEGRYRQQLENIRCVTDMTLLGLSEEERKDNGGLDFEAAIILINNMLMDTERATRFIEEMEE